MSKLADKKQAHNQFDIIDSLTFIDPETRKRLRSARYRLLAAFYGDLAGLLDPFAGDHHIKNLTPEKHEDLKKFMHYLIYELPQTMGGKRGNIAFAQAQLHKFNFELEQVIKSSGGKIEAVLSWVSGNRLVNDIKLFLRGAPVADKKETPKKEAPKKEKEFSADEHYIEYLALDAENKSDLAEKHLQLAVEGGCAEALFSLGEEFFKKKDYPAAFSCFEKAAENGNAAAMINLGHFYAAGRFGVKQDFERARMLYEKALESGGNKAAEALFELGNVCLVRRGDYEKEAFKYYKAALNLGYVNALNNLGICYEKGLGVPVDRQKALECFQNAASLGSATGYANLGRYYQYGYGVVEKNPKKARELYEQAVEKGTDSIMVWMGLIALYKDEDREKAMKYLGKLRESKSQHVAEALQNTKQRHPDLFSPSTKPAPTKEDEKAKPYDAQGAEAALGQLIKLGNLVKESGLKSMQERLPALREGKPENENIANLRKELAQRLAKLRQKTQE
jgi:TPR repeat protein